MSCAAALPLTLACAHADRDTSSESPRAVAVAEVGDGDIDTEALVIDDTESLAEVNDFYDWRKDAHQATRDAAEADSTTVYVSVEPFLAPTLDEACGWPQPEFHFASDSAELGVPAQEKVRMLAICLTSAPLEDDPISIVGHADPRGTEEYNRELGLRRANAIADALVAQGVERDRIDTYSRGEMFATGLSNDTPRVEDRRVVVRLDL